MGATMKRITTFIVLVSLFAIFSAGSINAQGKLGIVGKKFTKEEANVLFGKVIGSVQITKAQLKSALAKSKDYVLLKVANSRAYILNEKKVSLMDGETISFSAEDPAYLISKSVVEEFVTTSKVDVFFVEVRASVLSISDGVYVLEQVLPCPPMCN